MDDEEFSIISHMDDISIDIKPKNIIVVFDKEIFIEQIFESYKNDLNNILRQFIIDYNRLNIIINGKKYKKIDDIIIKFSSYDNCDTYIKNKKISSLMFLIMLCCQSSFFYSFYYIHKQTKIELNQLSDISGKEKTIKIILDPISNKKKILFIADYMIIDSNKNLQKFLIKTKTELDLNSSHGIINVDII